MLPKEKKLHTDPLKIMKLMQKQILKNTKTLKDFLGNIKFGIRN